MFSNARARPRTLQEKKLSFSPKKILKKSNFDLKKMLILRIKVLIFPSALMHMSLNYF